MQWVKPPGVQENLNPKTNELNDRRTTNISAGMRMTCVLRTMLR